MTATERDLDLVCLGRAAVDLYGEQIGSPLEDVTSFAKSLGGCAANVAVGAARQGLKVAMLTRVGDEHMGRFVKASLRSEGVDVSAVSTDPDRLTGLVLLSIRDRDTFPLIFYRERCADMGLTAEHVDPALIARARALLLTGTHLSTESVRAASVAAADAARAAGTKVVLDIDFRPVLWGLTGHGRGEDRFVASAAVTRVLQDMLPYCDLVVGTEEEVRIAGGVEDALAALRQIRARTPATIVMKQGRHGCVVFEGDIPDRVQDGRVVVGYEVEVLNVLGAGDAFLAGFLRGWIGGEPVEQAARYANACGALVVSRHACAPAIPTRAEIDACLSLAAPAVRIDDHPEIDRLHRVTTRGPADRELCVLAFDHRAQLEAVVDAAHVPRSRLRALKGHIAEGAARAARRTGLARPGVIVDDRYGADVLDRLTTPAQDWWVARPIERAADPALSYQGDPNVELELLTWPKQHVVKCLVHPVLSDHALTRWQHARLVRLSKACVRLDRALLLEVLPRQREGSEVDPELLPQVLDGLYDVGLRPDWWKLPPPDNDDVWRQLDAVVDARDPDCRGVLVLGLDAPPRELAENLVRAGAHPLCCGFAVGRTIFFEAASQWLEGALADDELSEAVAVGFEAMVIAFRKGRGGRG